MIRVGWKRIAAEMSVGVGAIYRVVLEGSSKGSFGPQLSAVQKARSKHDTPADNPLVAL